MNYSRRDFVKMTAAFPVVAALPVAGDSATVAALRQPCKIKRGVSLYSYQEEYYLGAMSLEDCIAEVADMGADGVELIAEMMVPDFPDPSDRWVANWHRLMDKYGTVPACYDNFLELRLYKDRPLTTREAAAMMMRDIKLANKLGFKTMRTLRATPYDVIKEVLPFAEKHDVRVATEIHSPMTLNSSLVQEGIELIAKTGTTHFGFVPDFSIYVKRPMRVAGQYYIRRGAQERVITYVASAYERGQDREATMIEVKKMRANEHDVAWVSQAYGFGPYDNDPKDLLRILPYIMHIHAKFYEMTEDLTEYSIAYDTIIPVLIQGGYDKYLSSEFEGQRYTEDLSDIDSCEQIRRQHAMCRHLFAKG